MNPLFQQMKGNSNPIISQFMKFQQNFKGDPRAQIQEMLNSGRISQADYDRAVQMAQQLQQMLTPSAHR